MRRKMQTEILVIFCGLLLLAGRSSAQSFTFAPLDVPCTDCAGGIAMQTVPWGINEAGDVVGGYVDATGFQHGFLLSGSIVTTIDVPGSLAGVAGYLPTLARGISPGGDIVGQYTAPVGSGPECTAAGSQACVRGFLYSHGNFTDIVFPGYPGAIAMRITPKGDIYGCLHGLDLMASMQAFVRTRDGYTRLGIPASMFTGATPDGSMSVGLITDLTAPHWHGFILQGGNLQTFDFPGSVLTYAYDVNPSGAIVGRYQDVQNGQLKTHGYLLVNGVFTAIDFPDSTVTVADAINPAGMIVGQYTDDHGHTHGFTAVPAR